MIPIGSPPKVARTGTRICSTFTCFWPRQVSVYVTRRVTSPRSTASRIFGWRTGRPIRTYFAEYVTVPFGDTRPPPTTPGTTMFRRKRASRALRRAGVTGPAKSEARSSGRRFATATARAWFWTGRAARLSTSRLTSHEIARPVPSSTRPVYSAKRSLKRGLGSVIPRVRASSIARRQLDRHRRAGALEGRIRCMATTEDRREVGGGNEKWRKELYERAPEREGELFSTISGLENEPLYTPETAAVDYERDLGYPGVYPFTRGVYPSMYRGRLWTMRQFAGFGTAQETNERFRYLLEHGQTGLSTAFDMPTLMGYDSDHERSLGEVGREGVAIDSLEDMEALFDGIPLGEVTTSMTINAPAAILLAYYVLVGESQGVPPERLGGTIQTDILKEYIAQKEWCFPIEPAMRLVTDMIEWCTEKMPRWHPVSISGYHIREAGSTAQQELAFTLKDGFTYVERAIERGLDVDEFAPRLSFFFNSHIDFFEEIAKYRAARRIWARELRDTYGAKSERSLLMRFHTQTAGVSLTAQQRLNNIVRTAIEALAAVMGGTQSLHTNSYDEA